MATNVKIIHSRDFIRAKPDGKLDYNEMKELLMAIVDESKSLVNFEVVLDTRKADSKLSMFDFFMLAIDLTKIHHFVGRKIAIICPTERFDNANFFAQVANYRGSRVRAFISFEDAIEWIIAEIA
jgi:hypothetical protein